MSVRPCPFCGQSIRSEAIKCRHCRRMLEDGAPPERPPRFASEVWVPIGVMVGGLILSAVLLATRRSEPLAPRPPPAVAESTELTPDGGVPPEPAREPEKPKAPPPEPAGAPAAVNPAREIPPAPRRTGKKGRRVARAAPEPTRPAGPEPEPTPPKPEPTSTPAPVPEPPSGPPRELKSDLFGYLIRLPNERAWQMGFLGVSRHGIVRRDGTASLQVWTEAFPQRAEAEPCLRIYLRRLRTRLTRAGLRIRANSTRTRAAASGLTIHEARVEASGGGPRRQAGRYDIGVTAENHACYAIEAFIAESGAKAARREVQAAVASFDVDPTVRRRSAANEATRAQLLEAAAPAEQTRNQLLLMDLATAVAALWPSDAQGWQMLGAANLLAHRVSDALRDFQRALAAPAAATEEGRLRRFLLYTLVADAHARGKKWDQANAALEEAKKIVPDHPALFYARACLQAMRGEVEKAMDSLESSFRSWPARAAPPRVPLGLGKQVALARKDDRLRVLQQEPRFEILLRRFEARARKAE